jgi:hypothetical protein
MVGVSEVGGECERKQMRTRVAGARSEWMSVERAITLERVNGGCVRVRV